MGFLGGGGREEGLLVLVYLFSVFYSLYVDWEGRVEVWSLRLLLWGKNGERERRVETGTRGWLVEGIWTWRGVGDLLRGSRWEDI